MFGNTPHNFVNDEPGSGNTEELLAKKCKSIDETKRAKDTCPQFFEESVIVAQQLQASKEEILASKERILTTMNELLKYKDEVYYLRAERAVYLKAALKIFQRGIVELELQVFLGTHTSRSTNGKQFFCGSPPVGHNGDFSSLMLHWRTCPLHTTPPVIVDKKQVEARQFKAPLQNVETAVDNLYTSLSTSQNFKTDYPIKLTPFTEDADTLALVSFLDFYKVDYCLLCDEQGKENSIHDLAIQQTRTNLQYASSGCELMNVVQRILTKKVARVSPQLLTFTLKTHIQNAIYALWNQLGNTGWFIKAPYPPLLTPTCANPAEKLKLWSSSVKASSMQEAMLWICILGFFWRFSHSSSMVISPTEMETLHSASFEDSDFKENSIGMDLLRWWRQFYALNQKNVLVLFRRPFQTLSILIIPSLTVIILLLGNQNPANEQNNNYSNSLASPSSLNGLGNCNAYYASSCLQVAFSPLAYPYDEVMRNVAASNKVNYGLDIKGFKSSSALTNYVANNIGTVQFSVFFVNESIWTTESGYYSNP
eukprot:gene26056-34056_t